MADEFEDHTSNDWLVPRSAEAKAVLEASIRHNRKLGGDGLDLPVQEIGGQYFIWDHWLMSYLGHRSSPGQPPLEGAELLLAGDLLASIAEDEFNLLVEKERIAEARYLAARCQGKKAVSRKYAGPATTAPESIPTADRPGVNERWEKAWKAALRNNKQWFENYWTLNQKEMADYVQTGVVLALYASPPVTPPVEPWEKPRFFPIAAKLRLWSWQRTGVEEGRWNAQAATSAFMAHYLETAIERYRVAMAKVREPDLRPIASLDMPFTALGFVVGQRERAELAARLHLHGFREGRFEPRMLGPLSAFMLRLLAEYFDQEPITETGKLPLAKKKDVAPYPVLQQLLEAWSTPDPAVLAPRLVAACDVHTHQSVQSGYEIGIPDWMRTPIAVLLVLKLRELRGLANPAIDHPLTATVVGRLPDASTLAPADEMLLAVEARMRADGFDEKKVLAACGIA
jgi:hypothetical protein